MHLCVQCSIIYNRLVVVNTFGDVQLELPACPFSPTSFHLFLILLLLTSSGTTPCSLFPLLLVFPTLLFSAFKNICLS